MAPDIQRDLAIVIDTLSKQIQVCMETQTHDRSSQEALRSYIVTQLEKVQEQFKLYTTHEEFGEMKKEMTLLQTQLQAMKEAILTKQGESYKQIIVTQASVLFAIFSTILGFVLQIIFHH